MNKPGGKTKMRAIIHKITRFEFVIIVIVFLLIFLVKWLYSFPTPLSDANYINKHSEPVVLGLALYSSEDELHKLHIEDFLNKNTGVELKVDTYPIDLYYNVLSSELVNSNSPDIIMVEHPAVIDNLIPSKDLIPLNNYITSSYCINNDLTQDNSHYLSPPTSINPYVIYCNDDILSLLNVNLENPTLREFISVCKKINSKGFTPIVLGARSWPSIRNMVIQLSSDLAEDPWQSAMDNMSSLTPYFQEKFYLYDSYDAQVAFMQGKACFYFGTDNEKEKIASECDFEPITIHLQLDGSCTIWYDYVGMYALSMKAKNKLPALNLLKYITKKSENKITQDYLSSLEALNNTKNYQYKCNWMFNDNGKNIQMYMEKLKNYAP